LDLFDYSKLNSWDFELSMNEGDICEFLRTLIASYVPLMEENGFNYNFHIPDEAIYLPFDNENLDRALSNLIINSTKYNPSNTTITVSCYKDNKYLNIIVEDDGIGIPKDRSESMFDPFTRGDESRTTKNPGTGLGLAITKAVILKHKGSIRLISDVNKGCKFIIKLPLRQ
jgi:signal transduction histidine kinase